MPDNTIYTGILFYDRGCLLCTRLALRYARTLEKRGFELDSIRGKRALGILHLRAGDQLGEMRLLTSDGITLGGADALIHIARYFWWGGPIRLFAWLPGARNLLRRTYRWVAVRRNCLGGACSHKQTADWRGWSPLIILPVFAMTATWRAPGWLVMWTLATAIYLGCKWLTWWETTSGRIPAPFGRTIGYLLLWPGMDANDFLAVRKAPPLPPPTAWIIAGGKTIFGVVILWGVARCVPAGWPLIAGWVGMLGIIFTLHFGLFHLAALAWQASGINAKPIMRMPVAARSLGEFWSVRWNRGFNDLAYQYVFRAVLPLLGVRWAIFLTFLLSGLIHEVVISFPARGGYGLPTLYFVVQGFGLLVEKSRLGRYMGLRRGARGRLFTLIVAAAPAYWLFNADFVQRVIIPFLKAIRAI